jgi:salicylate hydroxylase
MDIERSSEPIVTMKVCRVAVVGAGPVGLLLVRSLIQKGFDVTLFERHSTIRADGTGVVLAPNGLRAIDTVDRAMYLRLVAEGVVSDRFSVHTFDGRQGSMHHRDAEIKFGYPFVLLKRETIQQIFADPIDVSVILTGYECVNVREAEDIELVFANGKVWRGDLVIGSDGIRSAVRRWVAPHIYPHYVGSTSWRALVPRAPGRVPSGFSLFSDGAGRLADLFSVDGTTVHWGVLAPSAVAVRQWDADESLRRLRSQLAGVSPLVHDLVAATDPGSVITRPIYELPSFAPWRRGRLVLAGDAAHAMLPSIGQGLNMGLEDATVLADALDSERTLGEALDRYQRARVARVNAVHRYSSERWFDTMGHRPVKESRPDRTEVEAWLFGYDPTLR